MAGPKTRGGSPPALGSIEGPHVRAGWLNLGFTTRESSTQKPRITISITIIAFFIVELVDAAGLLGAVRGLQIFYTRTSPSRSFDLLSDDFDYVVLLLMITGLATLTGSFWWWSKNKDLASAWR